MFSHPARHALLRADILVKLNIKRGLSPVVFACCFAENNLNLATFTGFTGQKLNYDSAKYIKNPDLAKRINNMPVAQQQAIAELVNGCIKTHTFYLTKASNTLTNTGELDMVPYYTFKFAPCETLYTDLTKNPGKPVSINFGGDVEPLVIPQLQYTRFIFHYINGEYSVREILAHAHRETTLSGMFPSEKELSSELQRIFNYFFSYELMYMRHRAIKPYKNDYQL
jgi:hypothetical protein